MARNPKLDVFRITLKPFKGRQSTFKDFFQQKYIATENIMSLGDKDLLNMFFDGFIKSLDTDEFIKNDTKQKVFGAYNSEDEQNRTIAFHSDKMVIEGTFEGGKFGNSRSSAPIKNKKKKTAISEEAAILDNFYFFIHTPLDSDTGVLMLQSYTEETIRDVFVPNFFQPYFSCSNCYFNINVEPFVPKSYKEKFAKEARLRAFSFTGKQLIGKKCSDTVTTEQEEFIISIKVVPKDKNGTTIDSLGKVLDKVTASTFNDEELANFQHKILLTNSVTGKHAHYDISDDITKIRPTITLDEINKTNGKLDFSELKQFCFDLLIEVNKEIQKINLIHEC